MKITFGNHDFLLHPSGVLFWPAESLLIVSDLHLEKGSHFAGRGYFLPPYDSHETLVRLYQACAALEPRQILLLGDCFHDPQGHDRLPEAERGLFEQLKIYDPIWVVGNHDAGCVVAGFSMQQSHERSGIVFRHEAEKGISNAPEISGHYHPKVDVQHKGAIISRRCFIEDGRRLILPSFGSYTGGLSVTNPSIKGLFTEPRIYALGEKRLYRLSQ